MTSTGGGITLGSAASGGTQTLHAAQDIALTQLTTTAGDVDATSDAGSITGGSIHAQRSATLIAALDNTGDQLVTATGSAKLTAGGLIDWNNIQAATTLYAASAGGALTLGTATSGGTQYLSAANDITFAHLTTTGVPGDEGDIALVAGGAILGGDVNANGLLFANANGMTFGDVVANVSITLDSSSTIAGNDFTTLGVADMNAAGAMKLGNLSSSTLSLSSPSSLILNNLSVQTGANFAVNDLQIGVLRQNPNATGPLAIDLTGYKGGVGDSATIGTIDAPNGVLIPELWEGDTTIATNASLVTIESAVVTRTLDLTTASDKIWVNDQTSAPRNGFDVQLFQPGYAFYLTQNGTFTTTNAFVVQYDDNSAIVDQLSGNIDLGASFARDFNRQGWLGDSEMLSVEGGSQTGWQFPVEAFDLHLQNLFGQPISLEQPGQPAVSIGDSDAPTELVSDGRGFTIIVKRRH